MAYLDATVILRAVRQRLVESLFVNVRQPPLNRFESGTHEAQEQRERSTRAVVAPRVEARITSIERHSTAPPIGCDRYPVAIELEVACVRHFALHESVSAIARELMRGEAARDADIVRQALTWPGSLALDASSNATGLVSGCLVYEDSSVGEIETSGGDMNGSLSTTHSFSGIAIVEQQIYPVATAPSIITPPTITVL